MGEREKPPEKNSIMHRRLEEERAGGLHCGHASLTLKCHEKRTPSASGLTYVQFL